MIPGLSHDDIYIMVEDEFLATAHTFTRHLHQAEYQRLKQQMREKGKAVINVERPTDGRTKMSEAARKSREVRERDRRFESMGREAGQKRRVAAAAARKAACGSSSEEEEEDEVEVGTALGDLIRRSALKRQMGSLSGLDGIKSDTRAAKGYKQTRSLPFPPPQTRDTARVQRPTAAQPQFTAAQGNDSDQHPSESSSHESDDLDSRRTQKPRRHATSTKDLPKPNAVPPPQKRPEPPPSSLSLAASDLFDNSPSAAAIKEKHIKIAKEHPHDPESTPATASLSSKVSNSGIRRQQSKHDDDDSASIQKLEKQQQQPPPPPPPMSSFAARRLKAKQQAKEREEKGKKGSNGGMSVDEVPVFLI